MTRLTLSLFVIAQALTHAQKWCRDKSLNRFSFQFVKRSLYSSHAQTRCSELTSCTSMGVLVPAFELTKIKWSRISRKKDIFSPFCFLPYVYTGHVTIFILLYTSSCNLAWHAQSFVPYIFNSSSYCYIWIYMICFSLERRCLEDIYVGCLENNW